MTAAHPDRIEVQAGARAPDSPKRMLIMQTTQTRKTTLRASDLSCPSCVVKIEKALRNTSGVTDANVFFETGRIVIEHDPSRVTADDLVKTVADVGYTAKRSAF
jgi:copper chaperone CopZ